jgi:hypothetical protein
MPNKEKHCKSSKERTGDDFEEIVLSAIENPQNQTANFEELRERAIKDEKGSGEKIVFNNRKYKLIFKIKWDKSKFFFSYSSTALDKMSNEKKKRVLGVDDPHNHRPQRHLHSGSFTSSIPTVLIEKLEHPILSLIVNSETEIRRKEWIKRLANELKNSQVNWKRHLSKKVRP